MALVSFEGTGHQFREHFFLNNYSQENELFIVNSALLVKFAEVHVLYINVFCLSLDNLEKS